MRTNARSLPALVSAVLLAASAATMPGCAKASPPQPPQNTPTPTVARFAGCAGKTTATIFVEVNGTAASTRNKTVYLCEGDTVEWVSVVEGAKFTNPKWKGDVQPYDGPPTHGTHDGKKPILTSPALKKKNTPGNVYEHDISLVLADGKTTYPVKDPRIVIMP